MGLDITAYSGLAFVKPSDYAHQEDENGNPLDHDEALESLGLQEIHVNPDFASRAADLPNPCVFSVAATTFGFRAGGYSGYCHWREALADIVGYEGGIHGAWRSSGGKFWELIHFSDCEGAIGPSVSAKLSRDFEENRAVVEAACAKAGHSHFMEIYECFAKAFAIAANGGAVSFH